MRTMEQIDDGLQANDSVICSRIDSTFNYSGVYVSCQRLPVLKRAWTTPSRGHSLQ